MTRKSRRKRRIRKILSRQKQSPPSERVDHLGYTWTLSIPVHRELNILDLMIHPRCKVRRPPSNVSESPQ